MRLIDADKLYEDLADNLSSIMGDGTDGKAIDTYVTIGDIIHGTFNAQPTAYDVDAVEEQLEKEIQTHERCIEYEKKNGTITEEFQQRKAVEVLKDAIEIVKGGGVDGN